MTTKKKRTSSAMPTARVRDAIADRFRAGDSAEVLAMDYDVRRTVVEKCVREELKRTRKQTTQRVSRIAAKLMALARKYEYGWFEFVAAPGSTINVNIDVRTIAASCLSQDERKGK